MSDESDRLPTRAIPHLSRPARASFGRQQSHFDFQHRTLFPPRQQSSQGLQQHLRNDVDENSLVQQVADPYLFDYSTTTFLDHRHGNAHQPGFGNTGLAELPDHWSVDDSAAPFSNQPLTHDADVDIALPFDTFQPSQSSTLQDTLPTAIADPQDNFFAPTDDFDAFDDFYNAFEQPNNQLHLSTGRKDSLDAPNGGSLDYREPSTFEGTQYMPASPNGISLLPTTNLELVEDMDNEGQENVLLTTQAEFLNDGPAEQSFSEQLWSGNLELSSPLDTAGLTAGDYEQMRADGILVETMPN